ncbi:MAG: ParA family protein [Chloroflexota bacterium]
MATIFAISNEKGGVAKTTTSLAIGGALAEAGYKVLLVDLDAQANLTIGIGIQPAKVKRSMADVLLNGAPLVSACHQTAIAGLDIAPANAEMGMVERFLPVRQNYEYALRNVFSVPLRYDFVLLDCPPSIGAVTFNALTAAAFVVIPTQPEYFSAHGLRSLMGTIRKVRSQTNPDLAYYVLITMMDRRNRIHRALCEQLQATFGEGLLRTVIEIDTKLRESTIAGLPITHYNANTRSAQQYRALAQEIVENAQAEQATQSA